MALTPNTNIRLLKVPFEIDNKNQLTFSSKQAQTNYFLSLPAIEIDKAQYQRKNNIMYFPAHIDSIMEYNYVMYQNDNYSDKWFYAFITNKAYNNDGLTDLTLKTDVFQTWQFDIIYKRSFIEREHVNDDTIGKHTIPENLDVGEVICENEINDPRFSLALGYWVIVESVYDPYEEEDLHFITINNNNLSGSRLYAFAVNIPTSTSSDNPELEQLVYFISKTTDKGKFDAIKSMYILPLLALPSSSLVTQNGNYLTIPITGKYIKRTWNAVHYETTINKITSFDGLSIKNNKCFTYPYNYLYVTNKSGSNNIYRYENFYPENSGCKFKYYLTTSIGCDGKAVPLNYKYIEENDDEAIPLAKYPTCSWSGDAYTNWLTQNAVNIPVSIASSVLSIAGSVGSTVATGGALAPVSIGAGISAASTLANTIGEFAEASLLPSITSGVSNGSVNFSSNKNGFSFYQMRAKGEYLKIIDNFFSMYGYKINDVKTPNINGRSNWNYVKTIDVNLIGEIPQEDLEEIKQIFNNGVTFWHNPSTFLDYSQNNNIV